MGPFGVCEKGGNMSELVARTGRLQQRYEDGCRLVAGCIPFRYRSCDESDGTESEKIVEVLMINSTSGPGLLFPKDCVGYYNFKSKTLQDDFSPEGLCKAAMFALLVKEELEYWPEQSTRQRKWLTIPEALECCRHPWMRKALEEGFMEWHARFTNTE
ncbi:nudix hydrolase 16, mitochondrial-like isoform X2 [Amaranthus tricolor]|uniref:nudix hydrolase 16, mitochondrial-like isoform X2 n=1 Tax=Amaranthus tricolor TaxID=29722 RepID=UPI002582A737|nr:nudix hydrolase 16, mitochondrial-like isoform X2 [Amaranthus tricolor]